MASLEAIRQEVLRAMTYTGTTTALCAQCGCRCVQWYTKEPWEKQALAEGHPGVYKPDHMFETFCSPACAKAFRPHKASAHDVWEALQVTEVPVPRPAAIRGWCVHGHVIRHRQDRTQSGECKACHRLAAQAYRRRHRLQEQTA